MDEQPTRHGPTPQEGLDLSTLSVDAEGAGAAERISDLYGRYGCVLLRGMFNAGELVPLQAELRRLIDLLRAKAGLACPQPTSDERFDSGFLELVDQDPEAERALFDASRRLPAVHRLSVAEKPLALVQQLMGCDLPMVNPYKTVRIDYAQREDYLLPWHQDYPYVQDSKDALILWIPLHDVDERNGCVMVAPWSHHGGIQSVRMEDCGGCGKNLTLAGDRRRPAGHWDRGRPAPGKGSYPQPRQDSKPPQPPEPAARRRRSQWPARCRRSQLQQVALGAAGLLVLGDLAAQGDLLLAGRGVDLPQRSA
jgi:hypothetical protein